VTKIHFSWKLDKSKAIHRFSDLSRDIRLSQISGRGRRLVWSEVPLHFDQTGDGPVAIIRLLQPNS